MLVGGDERCEGGHEGQEEDEAEAHHGQPVALEPPPDVGPQRPGDAQVLADRRLGSGLDGDGLLLREGHACSPLPSRMRIEPGVRDVDDQVHHGVGEDDGQRQPQDHRQVALAHGVDDLLAELRPRG
jgi:hypothetical protein